MHNYIIRGPVKGEVGALLVEIFDDITAIEAELLDIGTRIHGAVADVAELKALDTTSPIYFPDRMVINVEDKGIYRLDRQGVDTPNDDTIVAPTTGVGLWYRMASALIVKNNYTAAIGPTINDDASTGYSVGSEWIDTNAGLKYYCLDSTTGAAIWIDEQSADNLHDGSTNAIVTLVQEARWDVLYYNSPALSIEYTSSGTDQHLTGPSDQYDTIVQFYPCAYNDDDDITIRLLIGSYQWTGLFPSESANEEIYLNGNNVDTTYGSIRFVSIGNNLWRKFADPSHNGLKTCYLPKTADNTIDGGYFEYYYHYDAWRQAFNGNAEDIVIAQNGDVYKSSIAPENLVVSRFGAIGAAGRQRPSIDYTEDGNLWDLIEPSGNESTPSNLVPAKNENITVYAHVGDNIWASDNDAGSILGWDSSAGSSTYGQIRFTSAANWNYFADESNNGLQVFFMPNSIGGNGGFFIYFYHEWAWRVAFEDNNTDVIIAQNGDVYKDNIDNPQNLVVTKDGIIGPAGYTQRSDNVQKYTHEPTGFPDKDHIIAHTDGSLLFRIIPNNYKFEYFIKGIRYTKASTQSVNWTDVEGLHYFYYDGDTLTHSTLVPSDIITEKAFVSVLYWDADSNVAIYFGDERHGVSMDGATHYHWHHYLGTVWHDPAAITGIVTDGIGNSATHAQFGYSLGKIADEDLIFTISAVATPASIPIFYKSGAAGNWRRKTANTYPVIYSGTAGYTGANGRLPYNQWTGATWQLSEVGNNNCIVMLYFATNDVNQPIVGIQGQNEYATITAAREGILTELSTLVTTGLPFTEFAPLAGVIFQTSTTYSNVPKARTRTLDTGEDYLDLTGIHGASIGAISPGGTDSDAIHKSASNEIASITEKTDLHDDDIVIIEDSESGYIKKKSTVSNFVGSIMSGMVFETAFPCDRSGSEYTFRTRAVSSSGSFEFGFNVPIEADVVEGVYLQGITTAVPGTPGDPVSLDFTIDTNYGQNNEDPAGSGETDVTLPVTLTANAGSHDRIVFINVYKADAGQTLFANTTKGDMCGMNIQNPSSTTIEWTGIIVRWRKTSF